MVPIYLSIVVPAFNEERRIGKTLSQMRQYLQVQDYNYELIVSDDGSTDTTPSIVNIISEGWSQLKLIRNDQNAGKGEAVKRGVAAAMGAFVLFTDADNATPLAELEKLWPHVGEYDIVFGSRHIKGARIHIPQARHRAILSRLSNRLIRVVAVPQVFDTQCGFKLYRTPAAKNIFANVCIKRFGFDIESFVIAKHLNYRYYEVGINWYNDFDTRVRTGREALRTLVDLFKIRRNMWRGEYDSVGYVYQMSAPLAETPKEPATQIKTD